MIAKKKKGKAASAKPKKSKKPQHVDVLDKVQRVEEIEALRFAKLDTEIRNTMQGLQLLDFELEKEKREFELRIRAFNERKKNLDAAMATLRPQYKDVIDAIAEKYCIAPENIIIDPDSLIIRDGSKT